MHPIPSTDAWPAPAALVSVAAAGGRPAASRTLSGASGRPVETARAASWDRAAAARARARADRRARASVVSGNGPRPGQRPRAALWAAVPAGYRPAVNLAHWVGAVTDAAQEGFRSDAAQRRIELAWLLAKHTDWKTCTTRCGWDLLADRGCVSRRTVARFLAWLRSQHLIAVVSTGRTGTLTRPMALTTPPQTAPGGPGGPRGPGRAEESSGNEAAVYVLLEPIPPPRPYEEPDPGLVALDPRYQAGELTVDVAGRAMPTHTPGPVTADDLTDPGDATGTPNGSPLVTSQNTHPPASPRACSTCHRPVKTPLRVESGPPGLPPRDTIWPNRHPVTVGDPAAEGTGRVPAVVCDRCHATRWARHLPARTRADRLALADRLRHDAPPLTWVGSSRRLRWLLRDFLHAGWTAADLLHALDTHPVDGPYAYATSAPGTPGGLRNPAGWVLHRLKPWRGSDGLPVVPFSATHTAALAAQRAAHLARVAADRRAEAAVTGPSAAYQAARAALGRVRPR